jgi:glutamyl-tRNA synthetase
MIITRFSPSPTGQLHLGNIRTALINYLFTAKLAGKFLLRIDDTDLKRSKSQYTEQIIEDLDWLKIKYEEIFKQSNRLDFYAKQKDKLLKQKKIYVCFESEEELNIKRKVQLAQNLPPIYDRSALKLSEVEIAQKIAQGEKPYYRFLLDDEIVSWQDGVKGVITFKSSAFSDPVVIRADNSPTYTFCSVLDDIAYNITDIIRGEDHISNTAVQIKMFRSLGASIPNFHHLSLLKTKTGEMSKRLGGFAIRDLKKQGIDAMSINSLLAKLGTSDNVVPYKKLANLVETFDINKFSSGAINYNEKDLLNLNRKIVNSKNYKEIKQDLAALNITISSENFWNSIKDNIVTYLDIIIWQEILSNDFKAKIDNEDKDFLKLAAELLPDLLDADNFKLWIKNLSQQANRKGKDLYHPLRIALTNKENGPELSKIVPLLGYDIVKQRLL